MYEDGFKYICNIDFSSTVAFQMQDYYKETYPEMSYAHMDVRSMAFEDDSFNVVIDKGCLDAILCSEGSYPSMLAMFREINRVLTAGGVYICVTHGTKLQRLKYFNLPEFGWKIDEHMVRKPFVSASAKVEAER